MQTQLKAQDVKLPSETPSDVAIDRASSVDMGALGSIGGHYKDVSSGTREGGRRRGWALIHLGPFDSVLFTLSVQGFTPGEKQGHP